MSDSDQQKPNLSKHFSFDKVLQHMRLHHPGCPKKTSLAIAARVSSREWKGLKLGAAVGIELQKHVRHSYTDYDELLRLKIMTRDEARAFIAPQVQDILRSWQQPALTLRLVEPRGNDN